MLTHRFIHSDWARKLQLLLQTPPGICLSITFCKCPDVDEHACVQANSSRSHKCNNVTAEDDALDCIRDAHRAEGIRRGADHYQNLVRVGREEGSECDMVLIEEIDKLCKRRDAFLLFITQRQA